jgi:flagellar FliJ protein
MKGFTFRLQKVLDHRIDVEDTKKDEFVKSRMEYIKQQEHLESLKQEIARTNKIKPKKSTNIFSYITMNNYKTALNEKTEIQEKRVDIYRESMNQKKEEFLESKRDRKVIEKLKDKAHNEFTIDQNKSEQKQNDEFALYGYMKK